MFWEDEQYVRSKAEEIIEDIYGNPDKDKIGYRISNADIGGLGTPKQREPSAVTRQRAERSSAIRAIVRERLAQDGYYLRMRQPGDWIVCSLDAGMLDEYSRRSKRLCAVIQKQIQRMQEASDAYTFLKNPNLFAKLADESAQLVAIAEQANPNKRLQRNMKRLANLIPDYYL